MKWRVSFFKKLVFGLCLTSLANSVYAQYEDIDQHKLSVKSYLDFGHIVNGYNYSDPDGKFNIDWLPLNRMNVIAIQDMSIGNFDLSAGLAGLIWWPYGDGKAANLSEKVMQVKPMVPVARARWKFGDTETNSGSVQIGTFNYKYNSDAKNLGEYLYRSGTYPGILFTGEGWLLMNRAGNYSHGLLFSLYQLGGKLKHNASLFMETSIFPVGDFSPGYDLTYTSKWLEIGGGAVFYRYLSLRPSLLTSKSESNTYAVIRGKSSEGTDTTVSGRLDEIIAPEQPVDTVKTHWSLKGVKAMARATLNLNTLLPESSRNPEDLRIFFEVALLGVKDYPLYYGKKIERMPFMFGINIPTMKWLDILSVQGEYYKSPHSDAFKLLKESKPVPGTSITPSLKLPPTHSDDVKWSIYTKKTVNKLISVHAQAACDHFRLTNGSFTPSNIPLTGSWKKDWYYLLRFEFSLR